MTDITIPPAALEAAARAICFERYDGISAEAQMLWRAQARAACLAMLKAWPKRRHGYERNGTYPVVVLPIEETSDAEGGRIEMSGRKSLMEPLEAMPELVERVAEELWQAESVRVVGTRRCVPWSESGAQKQWLPLAEAAINIVLEEAAKVAEAFPAKTHGNLATAPYAAAEQAGDEIAAAIRKLGEQR